VIPWYGKYLKQVTIDISFLLGVYRMYKPIFVYDDNRRLKDEPSTTQLLGCIVEPTDGSYSVMLRSGKLVYSGRINGHKYRVITERGQFPTDSDHDNGHINDIMMVRVDDPTIVVFCQSRFLKIVSSTKPIIDQVLSKLRIKHPQILWHKGERDKVYCEFSLQAMHVLVAVDRIVKINVKVTILSNSPVIMVEPRDNWDNLLDN
jgi:hypothetical protein